VVRASHNLKNLHVEIHGEAGGHHGLSVREIVARLRHSLREGQRRYVKSLAYARQFLDQMEKPDVDFIEGLSQRSRSSSAVRQSKIDNRDDDRDLRLPARSFSAIVNRTSTTSKPVYRQTPQQIVDQFSGTNEQQNHRPAPLVHNQIGEFRDIVRK